ncbi:hypothetical protein [Pedobacter aquatilis]|uniref:hypothetical protein n=1 Tax=Pedobacter aquatilis TaxID=351343 RepID=UPI0029319260|nr:hypothetical protein [Pedobacter aquatilis]
MYQFFLCKSNIIEWKVKPKSILFTAFFQENVRISFMETLALLYTSIFLQTHKVLKPYGFNQKVFPFQSGLVNKVDTPLATAKQKA